MHFLQKFLENVKRFPDRFAVCTVKKRRLSYLQLDEYSSKVYHWLKNHGIGTNDMVMICLPRGTRLLVAVIGILRAGAAFVVAENSYPEERIAFIKEDCACKTVINEDLFAEMMAESPLSGYEETSVHDACFAVYTSGSTGNPKGVLHEYGKIDLLIPSFLVQSKEIEKPSTFAFFSPTSFIIFVWSYLSCIYTGKSFILIPDEIAKNPEKLYESLSAYMATDIFMPPSLLRITERLPECIINVYTGGESCNGLYREGLNLIEKYGSSESGMPITSFLIDRYYEKTPAGKNYGSIEIQILDRDGNCLPAGTPGEICFKNEYTRGYINLPEKTKEAFIHGIYHMGDYGYIAEDGNLYVVGRMDDMIKINGNRVEPSEIENVIRVEYGINNVVVKGFQRNGRTFLCAYVHKKEFSANASVLDQDSFRRALSKRLPSYMIPTYCVALDEFPKNANGKIDRKNLPAPETGAFAEAYTAPQTETEKYFCELFQKILKSEKVGVNDDFYLIGGESLSTMELLSECKYRNISANHIYSYRTPGKLAGFIESSVNNDDRSRIIKNNRAKEQEQPVLPEMEYVVDYQFLSLKSLMWNLPFMVRFEEGVDADRLARAVKKVFLSHPVMSTMIIFNEDGELCQKYMPDLQGDIPIVYTTEEELDERKKCLVQSFTPINKILHREIIFRTEKSAYLFFDFYHIISDGTSINLIMDQIIRCYKDETYQIPEDYYYLIVSDYFKYIREKEFHDTVKYYQDVYRKFRNKGAFSCLPAMDRESFNRNSGWFENALSVTKKEYYSNPFMSGMGGNNFFMTACVLAIARYNHQKNSFLQWVFHGRNTADELNSAGMLYKSLPLFSSPENEETLREYCEGIVKQTDFGKCTSNVLIYDAVGMDLEDALMFLYQRNMFNIDRLDLISDLVPLEIKNPAVDSIIEFEIIDNDGEDQYKCTIEYSADCYDHVSIERFFSVFDDTVKRLIDCKTPELCTMKEILEEMK